ncbi:OmpA family protein [Aureibaculum marinum]|uniref:OmpA family protein n=1 Tax=Aureibaculum marinum TaxID=2487930 RepID=A0A3N4NH90_9FLAO|nr:OmpA family protein [Aureibaculum marinum]RPD94098.1 OmpA family protein [Aureibaculum marinum]
MKNLLQSILFLILFTNGFIALAQDKLQEKEDSLDKNYFQISPRFGYDFPTYNNNTPYIDYDGGLDLGISLDYYWTWFGVGFDFDYIMNQPKSTYSTDNIFETDLVTPINSFNLTEDNITRMFYGIGPNFQYRTKSRKFIAELNTRVGLATIDGGRTYLEGTSGRFFYPLNFHAGYKDNGVLTYKGQVRFTYYISNKIGINAGAYYMNHIDAVELSEGGRSAMHQPLLATTDKNQQPINTIETEPIIRTQALQHDISSYGAFVGVSIKLGKTKTEEEECELCSETCNINITAKDKFTGQLLANTEIVLEDLSGTEVKTGTTNEFGMVVFKNVTPEDYVVKGKLHDVALQSEKIVKSDFEACLKNSRIGVEKEIWYTDENYILKGNVVECSFAEGIQGVAIKIRDKINSGEKNTISDEKGNFLVHLKQASTYALNGKKDGYYSNEVEVKTESYNRNKTLFIEFEMCIDPCGKAINLENINFDLDKADILPESLPDLRRIVKLMKDNPTIHVELSSHTDSQGSDAYNKRLSQRRADATVAYIVTLGISKDRLQARGAGESELKNTKCANNVPCTDEEHKINRRTEFKVICN